MAKEELDFEVVFVSGEQSMDIDDDHAKIHKNLLQEKSWVSTKFCNYPQEIILSLKGRCRLDKIRLMSHHSFVPEKVEFYIGNPKSGGSEMFLNAKYEKIGSITFANNRKRDNQTLYPDTKGLFLKMFVFENYHDREQNPFNQVGLTDIILNGYQVRDGEDSSDYKSRQKRPPTVESTDSSTKARASSHNSSEVSVADKTFTTEMRQIIKILEHEKKKAIRDERFSYAKSAKHSIHRLKETIDLVDKLEQQKREAIEDEDFDKAQELKDEIRSLRASIYAEVNLKQLLENNQEVMREIESDNVFEEEPFQSNAYPNNGSYFSKSHDNAYTRKDNTVLPAIRHRGVSLSEPVERESPDERLPSIEPYEATVPDKEDTFTVADDGRGSGSKIELPSQDKPQLTPAIKALGLRPVELAYSKKWEDRKESLLQLKARLEAVTGKNKDEASRFVPAATLLLSKALRDKVFQVYGTALDVLQYLCIDYTSKHKLAKTAGPTVSKRTHEVLITRTGDTVNDSRFRKNTTETLLNIIRNSDPPMSKAFVTLLLKPFEATGHAKIDQGHAALAQKIVQETNAPNPACGVDEHTVCMFAMSCLLHTDAEVRQAGVKLILEMYKHGDKQIVLQHLPTLGSKTVHKNPLFRSIYDELDKIDGITGSDAGRSPTNGRAEADGGRATNNTRRGSLVSFNRRRGSLPELSSSDGGSTASSGGRRPSVGASGRSAGQHQIDKTCVFCGEVNPKFLDENVMDKHYLRVCPMLKKCGHCNEMVEIASLGAHLLSDCIAKDSYKQCTRCKEPIATNIFEQHQKARKCLGTKMGKQAGRCVLCHADVSPNSDDGWRKHLIGPTGCKENQRRSLGIGSSFSGRDQQIVIMR